MAGDWIKWCKGLADKPEIIAIADMLSTSREAVAGHYMRVAEWMDSEGRPDDEANPDSDITIQLVSRSDRDKRALLVSHVDHVAHASGMADALKTVGWLEVTATALVFKRAARHNSETAKRRALASRRQSKHRAKSSRIPRHALRVTREEKRREEKKKSIDPPLSPLDFSLVTFPLGLDTPEVRQAIMDWLAYKRKRHESYKDPARQISFALKQFTDPGDLVAGVEASIGSNYVGLFPARTKGASSHARSAIGSDFDPNRPATPL